MGREARCRCRWGDRLGNVTALLESHELVVRGGFRSRATLASLEDVGVRGDDLEFTVAGERVSLTLGAAAARSWAEKIARPPPTLARKLGIISATRLHVRGPVDDDALRAALADAASREVPLENADLAVVRTDDSAELTEWVENLALERPVPPIWIVYRKGRDAPLGENGVRALMRGHGFMDTKIAAVSERLTALRFVNRR